MKTTWCNEEYDCEVVSLGTDNPKDEAAAPLKLTKVNGDICYVVAIKKDEDVGEKVLTQPSDGKVIAMCVSEADACLVAASINIARFVAEAHKEVMDTSDERMRELGFDTERMKAEINRLKKEGKSNSEIYDYMRSHKDEYRVAGKTLPKERGEW